MDEVERRDDRMCEWRYCERLLTLHASYAVAWYCATGSYASACGRACLQLVSLWRVDTAMVCLFKCYVTPPTCLFWCLVLQTVEAVIVRTANWWCGRRLGLSSTLPGRRLWL